MSIGLSSFGMSSTLSAEDMTRTRIQTETINKSLTESGTPLKQNLDKDDFLKLLITQLKHQDPANPMEDREFIAQMAQFSSMEQMLNVNKSLEKLVTRFDFQSSFDLLGKNVEIMSNQADMVSASGLVDSISKRGDDVFVSVNGKSYPASDITSISY